jgi:polyphenol oxidase
MHFHEAGALRYYTFESFDRYGLIHGMFTRHGGVSPAPWASLNLGGTVGDTREHVVENRQRIFSIFGRPVESIFDSWQVHGREVICTEKPRPLDTPHQKADAVLTHSPEITLFMRFADCVPVFLFDPNRRVIGMAHAGWRGTVDRVVAASVERMQTEYGSNPADLLAGIGPSICVEHYEIGQSQEVVETVRHAFGRNADAVLRRIDGAIHFDLWKANQVVLEESGVRQIEQAGLCTFCNNQDWYSHRAEKGKTGRYGALLAIHEEKKLGMSFTEKYE